MSATNNRAPISWGAYPKRWGNCRLTAHLHCTQQRQKLFQSTFLHLPPQARQRCVHDELLQGQASSGRNTALGVEVTPLCWPKTMAADCDGEGQALGALFLKGSAVLSTAFPFLQGDLQPFQTCLRDLSTASLCNDFLPSTFWEYKLSPRITSLTPLTSWFLLASVSYLYK